MFRKDLSLRNVYIDVTTLSTTVITEIVTLEKHSFQLLLLKYLTVTVFVKYFNATPHVTYFGCD